MWRVSDTVVVVVGSRGGTFALLQVLSSGALV